jgi:hypothetical protein
MILRLLPLLLLRLLGCEFPVRGSRLLPGLLLLLGLLLQVRAG